MGRHSWAFIARRVIINPPPPIYWLNNPADLALFVAPPYLIGEVSGLSPGHTNNFKKKYLVLLRECLDL